MSVAAKNNTFLVLLLLWCVTILAYLPVGRAAFVYDDFDYAVQNRLVSAPQVQWQQIFTTPYPPTHPEQKLYRPLVTLSYALDYRLWGLPEKPAWTPTGFHWTNLAWHLAVVSLLLALVRRLQPEADNPAGPWLAGLAVALFALHPLATESVAWIAGRAELMAAAFGLGSLLSAIRYTQTRAGGWLAAALAGFAAALLSKENAIVIPLLAGVLFWWQRQRANCQLADKTWHRLGVGYLGLALIYLLGRWYFFREVELAQVAYAEVDSTLLRLLTAGKVLARYVGLAILPYRQSVFHEVDVNFGVSLLACLVLGAVCLGLWQVRRRAAWLSLGGAWFFVALASVSNLVIPIGSVMAERFLYLPLAGLALGLGLGLGALNARHPRRGWIYLLVLVVVLHHGIKTCARAADWRNELTLWASAARVYPRSFLPQAHLGFAWLAQGDREQAAVHLGTALQRLQSLPNTTRTQFAPRIQAALQQAQHGSTVPKPATSTELEVIHQLARSGQLAQAAQQYESHLRQHPQDQAAKRALADCWLQLDEHPRAITVLRELLASDPNNGLLHGKLGVALAAVGQSDAARLAYAEALALDPADAISRAHLALLEMKAGHWADAARQWGRVLQTNPGMVQARYNRAACLYQLQQHTAALAELRQVLQAKPDHADARQLTRMIEKNLPRR